ncbi:hypothetical protein PT285_07410 [Lactobacillus sp. ESL0791]|uniref:hypothetical protein n=1 Tax=Lactobacillus sp. ESL0791 TaxID=2983234 RepID=UPI0023F66677|nr:hypothetical protein [Lactobacillus sp. ESL0791]MDF7639226.1 hypothetical protein [Lactobacillus sp. ESL0791]
MAKIGRFIFKSLYNSVCRVTILIELKDGNKINVDDYPQLQSLGTWLPSTKNNTNLHLFSPLSNEEINKHFSQITGLNPTKFTVKVTKSVFQPFSPLYNNFI